MYIVTITKKTVNEYDGTVGMYVHKANGSKISEYAYEYEISKEDRGEYEFMNVPTGEKITNEKSEVIFNQTFEDLGVAEVAKFLNN